MFIGISFKVKDQRVDKILLKEGYQLAECDIFYSPIHSILHYLALGFIMLLPWSLFLVINIDICWQYICIYFLLGYVICGYLNNTFVLTTDKLLVINPNFPFTRIVTYELNQIEDTEIYRSLLLQGICWIFFQSGNYVTITTGAYNFRYYCGSLCGDT